MIENIKERIGKILPKEITGKRPKTGTIEKVFVKGEGCVSKKDIIKRIKDGEKFNVKGTNVNAVPNKNPEYLNTDPNNTTEDNIGELPDTCK